MMDAIVAQSADVRIVNAIVRKLVKGGLRSRPFSYVPHDATDEQLKEVAAAEVRRSVERVQMETPEWVSAVPPQPGIKDVHRAIKALAPLAGLHPHIQTTVRMLGSVRGPSPRSDRKKWECASESFYLMDTLSRVRLTGHRNGSFFKIAALLYEALTGEDADMKNACSAALKVQRDRFGLGTDN
jgi:hypothetical protein